VKLKDAEKRLKNEPNNLGLRVQVAGLMREAGRSLEAVELYRSVALVYRDQGRTQQAIAVCRSILEIAPEDSACQGLLAMLQQRSTPRPSAPSRPPSAEKPRTPVAEPPPQPQAVMRGSPMPPAPEVPSLRPATSPTTAQRAATTPTPPARQSTPVGQRPLTKPPPIGSIPRPQPVEDKPIAKSPPVAPASSVRTKPPTRPQPVPPEPRPSDPTRRSSFDQTPLPAPVPYHLTDPTSRPNKISSGELDIPMDDDTRPDQGHSGLVNAARRISGLISDARSVPSEVDISAELDTRQRRKIASEELNKIAEPPPTIPIERVLDDMDDLTTPPPPPDPDDDFVTDRQRALTPQPRGSDEALPLPPTRRSTPSMPPIVGRTPSRPPGVISIPPKKSPSRPPGVVSIPPKTSPSQPPGSLTPPGGTPVARLKPPPGPPPRPGMPKIPRERQSDDELTKPRDRGAPDEDDD